MFLFNFDFLVGKLRKKILIKKKLNLYKNLKDLKLPLEA